MTRKKFLNYLFLVFLVFYTGTMLFHVAELERDWLTIILFLIGLGVAIFAHARKNYITIALLLVHMSIEWFEWSQKGMSIGVKGGLLNAVHVIMDFVFLSHELSAHMKKKRYLILTVSVAILLTVFLFGYFIIPTQEEIIEFIEPFVIGGVLGCVGSHLYLHLKRYIKKNTVDCCDH